MVFIDTSFGIKSGESPPRPVYKFRCQICNSTDKKEKETKKKNPTKKMSLTLCSSLRSWQMGILNKRPFHNLKIKQLSIQIHKTTST